MQVGTGKVDHGIGQDRIVQGGAGRVDHGRRG